MKKMLSIALSVLMLLSFVSVAEDTVIETTPEFSITVDAPEGYTFVEAEYGDFIGGLFKPDDENCFLYYTLLIAYSEEYAEVFGKESTLNDLNEEQMAAAIEELTADFALPEVTMAQTGLGTIVIIVDEQGSESEYVSILTVYHGYFVQLYIDETAGNQITKEQIQTALDIMTSLEVIEK